MQKNYPLSRASNKSDYDMNLSFSPIDNSLDSEESPPVSISKLDSYNNTLNRKYQFSSARVSRSSKITESLGYICIGCEKKLKIITELHNALKNSKAQIVLSEKHLKQYDHLLQIKDQQLKDAELVLSDEKQELEQKKIEIFNTLTELEREKRRIFGESQNLDKKKIEIEKLIQEYFEKKNEFLNITEIYQQESMNLTEKLLIKREDEIQRLLEEVSPNRFHQDTDPEKHCFTQEDRSSKYLEIKRLKKFEAELLKFKQELLDEQAKHESFFKEQLSKIQRKEKILDKEKMKVVEAQNLLQSEIQTINRIKSKLRYRKTPQTTEPRSFIHFKSIGSELGPSKTQENLCETEEIQYRTTELEKNNEKIKMLEGINEDLEKKLKILEESQKNCNLEKKMIQDELEKKKEEIENLQKKIKGLSREEKNTISENMLKLRITQLENLISVEGHKLQEELKAVRLEKENLKEELKRIDSENNELLNKCENLNLEKEKFRKISESLHYQLNSIRSEYPSSDESDEGRVSPIKDLKDDLETRLGQLRLKEDELTALEEILLKERDDLAVAAEHLENINQDLEDQKSALAHEQQVFKAEKVRLANLNKKLDEKSSALAEKEKEIFNFKNTLEEREKIMMSKINL